MRTILLLCGIILLSACQKRINEEPIEENLVEVIDTSFLDSKIVIDKTQPKTEAKYQENRSMDEQNPAIFLDLTDSTVETLTPDMANHYSQVRYAKLRHPGLPHAFFLDNLRAGVLYEIGMTTFHGLYSSIYPTPSGIIAGDLFFGFHYYDLDGNFKYTIAQTTPLPEYQAWLYVLKVEYDKSRELLTNFSVLGDNCLAVTETEKKNDIAFFNIPRQNHYLTRSETKANSRFHLLSPNSYIEYNYIPWEGTINTFMESFNMYGERLCQFTNYNSRPQEQSENYQNPEHLLVYHYNGELTIRQPYNDTIFRMTSPFRLKPEFITHSGNQKLDVKTALYGDKAGKLIRKTWLETNDFVFLSYTENYDHQGNRDLNAVKYFYRWFDKKSKQLYRIESDHYPEEQWIRNSIPEGIPLLTAHTKFVENRLYTVYNKSQLKTMIEHVSFSKLSINERQTIKKKYEELKKDELLIMILEQ